MSSQFNVNVYNYTHQIMKLFFKEYEGKVIKHENLTEIMIRLFGDFKPYKGIILKATSESQGHGKAWEIDIQEKVYGIENPKVKYKSNAKYDIPAEDNLLHGKNVSIKASGGMSLCMSDIRRMFKSENMDVVCIIWKQINPELKEAIKTVVFDFDEFKKTLIEDLKKCNYTVEEWLKVIDDYDKYVKNLPKEYYANSKKLPPKEKEHLIKKKPLCDGLKYFQVNPKIDSKQQRVQCSINLNKLNITKTITDGGILFGKEYTKIIISSPRKRNNKVSK